MRITFLMIFLCLLQFSFAQETAKIDKLINDGVQLEQSQQFQKAFSKYEEALSIISKGDYPISYRCLVYANMGYNRIQKGEKDNALSHLKVALQLHEKSKQADNLHVLNWASDIGTIHIELGEFDSTYVYYCQALEKAKVLYKNDMSSLVKYYYLMGTYYYNLKRYKEAISYIMKVKPFFNSNTEEDTYLAWAATNILGNAHNALVQMDSAVYYFKKNLNYGKQYLPSDHIRLAESYYNLAGGLNNSEQIEASIMYLDSAIAINKHICRPEEKAEFYYRGGQWALDQGKIVKAKQYFLESGNALLEEDVMDKSLEGSAWLQVAGILMREGRFSESKAYLESSCIAYQRDYGTDDYRTKEVCDMAKNMEMTDIAQLKQRFPGKSDEEIFEIISSLASGKRIPEAISIPILPEMIKESLDSFPLNTYLLQAIKKIQSQEYNEALVSIQTLFVELDPDLTDPYDFSQEPEINNTVAYPALLLNAILIKSLIYYGKATKGQHIYYLKRSLDLLEKCDFLINAVRLNSLDSDKMNFGLTFSRIYQTMVSIAAELQQETGEILYFQKAFYASEKLKAFSLLSEITDEVSLHKLAPKTLLEQEGILKMKILRLNEELAKPNSESANQKIKNQLLNTQSELRVIQLKLQREHSKYWAAKYGNSIVELQDFVRDLDNATMVLSYNFSYENTLDIIALSKKHSSFYIGKQVHNLSQKIDQLNKLIIDKNTDKEKYRRLLNDLSFILLPNIPDHITNLVIIPDGKLHDLPFQMLLKSSVKDQVKSFGEFPFLIKHYCISYSLSASIYHHQKGKRQINKHYNNFLLGYDPFNFGGLETIKPLGESNDRAVTIISGTLANKKDLYSRQLSDYRIVQIASHAKVNQEVFSSGIILGNEEFVRYADFYDLDAPVDLFFLMGCTTAKGKLIPGEGLIGLNRAIFIAGSSNILLSKFNVEVSSAQIFNNSFYKTLVKNPESSYPQAVKKATLSLLDKEKYSAPHFWAGYYLIQ